MWSLIYRRISQKTFFTVVLLLAIGLIISYSLITSFRPTQISLFENMVLEEDARYEVIIYTNRRTKLRISDAF